MFATIIWNTLRALHIYYIYHGTVLKWPLVMRERGRALLIYSYLIYMLCISSKWEHVNSVKMIFNENQAKVLNAIVCIPHRIHKNKCNFFLSFFDFYLFLFSLFHFVICWQHMRNINKNRWQKNTFQHFISFRMRVWCIYGTMCVRVVVYSRLIQRSVEDKNKKYAYLMDVTCVALKGGKICSTEQYKGTRTTI